MQAFGKPIHRKKSMQHAGFPLHLNALKLLHAEDRVESDSHIMHLLPKNVKLFINYNLARIM